MKPYHQDLSTRLREADPELTEAEIAELLEVGDLLWLAAHGAPPLEDDAVAKMLGLAPDSA